MRSRSIRTATFLAFSLGAPAMGQEIKPTAAFDVRIDTGRYRRALADLNCASVCDSLTRLIRPALQSQLSQHYRFLNWTNGAADDTVVIRLINAEDRSIYATKVELDIRSGPDTKRLVGGPVRRGFEDWGVITARNEDSTGWTSPAVRRAWASALVTLFADEDLIPEVFGRIPLRVSGTLEKDAALGVWRGFAPVTAQQVGAPSDVAPRFRINVQISPAKDTLVFPADIGFNICSGQAAPTGVSVGRGAARVIAFSCSISKIVYYPGPTDTVSSSIQARLNAATITPKRAPLLVESIDPEPTGTQGTVPPPPARRPQ